MKGQNNGTKTSDNNRQISQSAMLTNSQDLLYQFHP